MLSRVADALFWMSRYLERAECVARLLDVCFHLELDLRGVLAGPTELHWTALAKVLQQAVPAGPAGARPPQAVISNWLTFETDNPDSVMSCLARARANARSVRGAINSEMWRELNKLYLQLADPEFSDRGRESPHELYQAVEFGSHNFQGVCDATLTHDEGWQFIQLGKLLERAEKTLRILDVQYPRLQGLNDPADLPLSALQWAAVLRSCRAYEAYQRLYVGRVEPEHVVEFLLLHAESPRSVRFSLEAAGRALTAIEGTVPGRELSKADRLLGRMLADLRFGEVGQILNGDVRAFLGGLQERCAEVSRAVQDQYSLR
ncbi:MAG TPA: alpha-E domain-containing protein [Gemmataceae bacterium]|jgi:uncharacterized alpha-E superfamily protein|nr:alpha-E domain-containing protein [Gemmataceae bacterium]